MKKIFTLLLILLSSLFLSSCGLDEAEAIETYGEEYAYLSVDDFYVSDLNGDGYLTEDEYQAAEDMYGDINFGQLVTLSPEDTNLTFCLDSDMDQSYITASVMAAEEYNKIPGLDISYSVEDDCSTYDFSITSKSYDELVEDYVSDGYDLTEAELDVDELIAVNWIQVDPETGYVDYSYIYFDESDMDEMDQWEKIEIALHEMGHTFGLIDLYEEELAFLTIMFYRDHIYQPYTELKSYDIYNLEWMYNPDFVEDYE